MKGSNTITRDLPTFQLVKKHPQSARHFFLGWMITFLDLTDPTEKFWRRECLRFESLMMIA